MKLSQTPGRARRAALAAALFAGPPVCGALELAGPLVAPPATPLTTNGRAIADRYHAAMAHPDLHLPLAAVQNCVLRGSSDVVSQASEPSEAARTWPRSPPRVHPRAASQLLRGGFDDPHHALAIGACGLAVSGLCGSMWLRHLEATLGPARTHAEVGTKCACDYICWAPLANGAYILLVPLITAALDGTAPLAGSAEVLGEFSHFSAGAVPAGIAISAKLPQAMALELAVFGPFNVFSFAGGVSPHLRPVMSAMLACIFTIVVTTLGLC